MADLAAIILKADSTQVKKATGDLKKMGTTATATAMGVDKYGKSVKKGAVATQSATKTLLKLGAAYLTLRAALSVIKLVADFSDKMLELQAVSGATTEQLAEMEAVVLKLGASTRFTASEVASAMVNLARAGFTADEAMSAVSDTLNLAQAGVIGIAEAAAIASTAVRQFGLLASDVGRVGDALVTAANNANTTVSGLAQAMKFAGPVAKALGLSIEQTASLLGVMADAGIDASMAGTNLRGIMLAMTAPTAGAVRAIQGLGLSLADIDPRVHGVAGALRNLRDAGMDAADAEAIFGRRNVAAALAVAEMAERVDRLNKRMDENALATDKAAKIMDSGLGAALKRIQSAWQGALLETKKSESVLSTLANGLAAVITLLGDMETAGMHISEFINTTFGDGAEKAGRLKKEYLAIVAAMSKEVGVNVQRVQNSETGTTLAQTLANQIKAAEDSRKALRRLQAKDGAKFGLAGGEDALKNIEAQLAAWRQLLAVESAAEQKEKERLILFFAIEKATFAQIEAAKKNLEIEKEVLEIQKQIANAKAKAAARRDSIEAGIANRFKSTFASAEEFILQGKANMAASKFSDPQEARNAKEIALVLGRLRKQLEAEGFPKSIADEQVKAVKTALQFRQATEQRAGRQRGGTFGVKQGNVSFAALAGGFDANKKQIDNQKEQIKLQKKANRALSKIEKKIDNVPRAV